MIKPRGKEVSVCIHACITTGRVSIFLAASNVRVRKLTEEHPEVESLLKQKSNPTSTVELQDGAQKRYASCLQ